jgi:predicted nucleic acid-binding protein
MTDKVFLDTNILVYAIDCAPAEVSRRNRARELLHEHLETETGVISIQVLQEFYVASTKKIKVPLSSAEALEFIRFVSALDLVTPSLDILTAAVRLHQKHGFSFWDAMIIQSAVVARCNFLYSEDLQHGFQLDSLRIQNPFLR